MKATVGRRKKKIEWNEKRGKERREEGRNKKKKHKNRGRIRREEEWEESIELEGG